MAAGERDRLVVARRRARWTKHQRQVEAERLVFVDRDLDQDRYGALAAVGAARAQTSRQGPHGRWKTMTFLSSPNCSSSQNTRLT